MRAPPRGTAGDSRESQGPPTPGRVWKTNPPPPHHHLPRPVTSDAGPAPSDQCFLPVNTGSSLAEEPPRARGRPRTGRLTGAPAGQQAEQVAAGLLQQDAVVAFVRAVGVVVVSEVAQTVHCEGVCASLGCGRERWPHPCHLGL